MPALGMAQRPVDGSEITGGYRGCHVDPNALGVGMVNWTKRVVAVEKPVGFRDSFFNGDRVYVNAEAVARSAPPELELECFHWLPSFGQSSAVVVTMMVFGREIICAPPIMPSHLARISLMSRQSCRVL